MRRRLVTILFAQLSALVILFAEAILSAGAILTLGTVLSARRFARIGRAALSAEASVGPSGMTLQARTSVCGARPAVAREGFGDLAMFADLATFAG